MSGNSFHVHGPHDHELEHAAQHGDKDSFSGTIAVMTAILATVGALFSYMGGATQAKSKNWDKRSDDEMHLHHRWAQATTALQISIALAAIALLTKKNWLKWGVVGVAGIGLVLGAAAIMHF